MAINKTKLIGVSGKSQSGKDEFGKIYKYVIDHYRSGYKWRPNEEDYLSWQRNGHEKISPIETKKYADKVKDIVCILLNCTREQLEDPVYKEKPLGKSWDKWELRWHSAEKIDGLYTTYEEALEALLELGGGEWDAEDAITKIIMTPRLLMQLVGADCGRNIIHPNLWVTSMMEEYDNPAISEKEWFSTIGYDNIDTLKENKKKYSLLKESFMKYKRSFLPEWIITDVRFPNEVKAIEGRGGFVVRMVRYPKFFISRHNSGKFAQEPFDVNNKVHMDMYKRECGMAHTSETMLDNHSFVHYANNNGTIADLIEEVIRILLIEKIIENE